MRFFGVKKSIVVLFCSLIAVISMASQSSADMYFQAILDSSQVVSGSSTESGTAVATFVLDTAESNLRYSIDFSGMDLVPSPSNRTGFSDVDKIHIHNAFAGSTGPHILNIFGLPSEDDAELVVDYSNESLIGNYNDADAIDPDTGALFDQNSVLTTKLLSNFVDDLKDGSLYLAVHTAGQNGDVAVRGQIVAAVPEPSSGVFFLVGGMVCLRRRRMNR